MSNDIDQSFPYRLMLPNGGETPADVARHIGELVALLPVPFEDRERPALEGEELRGFHIPLCTIGGCLSDLERQIRDLIKANAAEYQRGASDGFREGCCGNPEVPQNLPGNSA
jgi:hypothetical protein